MSTAGKVLVVFIVLATLVWLILMGGVAQLNRNGNQALQKLDQDLEKMQADLEETQRQIATLRDQTTATQEEFDRQITALRDQQAELEKARSQIVETLTRVQYQLAIVEDTIKGARTSLEHRNAEHQGEEKAMTDLRGEVKDLKTRNDQLLARLQTLRGQFQQTYHTNLDMISKKR